MRSLISRQPSQLILAIRALVLAASTLAVASACDRRDEFLTNPSIVSPVRQQPAIVGANVTNLAFSPIATNESGQVAGTQSVGGQARAVLWTRDGGMQDLGTLGGTSSVAFAINDAGSVVGFSFTAGNTASHAFLWSPARGMEDLGTLGGLSSYARGINDQGQVVGDSYQRVPGCEPCGERRHAFLWTQTGGMQDLGVLDGDHPESIAFDINNAGQVVGQSFHPGVMEMGSRAFLWTPGNGMQDIGSFSPGGSIAYAINDAGQAVGQSWTPVGAYHAFLWTAGQGMRDLGTLVFGGGNSVAFGINDAGRVVGQGNVGPLLHAFLWSDAEGMEDLFPSTGMLLARDINMSHQVVGGDRVATLQLEPGNRPPVASVGGPYTTLEGSAVALAFSATDPDGDALIYRWDFGDGINGVGPDLPASHVYADNGTYTVALGVVDTKGGRGTATTTATVANVAPSIFGADGLTGPARPVQLVSGNATAAITIAFTDPAGGNDTYAARVECGNGIALTPNGITSPYTGTCTYTTAGIYTVKASVADEDGGTSAVASYRYIVVYDPGGPFPAGSGFYTIPGQGKHKAHFTFNVQFLPGHSVTPNGTARFWIPGGQIEFESRAIEMLVVSGSRAQFWGTGVLNGAAARFRITAVDGQRGGRDGSADAFRIELWQTGTLVFDTQPGAAQDAAVTTEIDGGNIQIRRQ